MPHQLQTFRHELLQELQSIVQYWMRHTIDARHGGFYGSVDNNNMPVSGAPKGVVLHARILWTFATAYHITKDPAVLAVAARAYEYIRDHFTDTTYGGVYWSLDEDGQVLDNRKQIYGLAFCIYGCSAYAAATGNREALDYAIALYRLIEQHSLDKVNNGYIEAFAEDWGPLADQRLSAKDLNARKTMNTHLHIIEAYAALYTTWPDTSLLGSIENLLALISRYFIHHDTHHLRLFFDDHWNEQPDVISYGHDIEAAWLLLQCAEVTGNREWIDQYRQYAITLADAALRGMDADGGLWYEYHLHTGQLIKEKHWWPQAEAMIGCYNAWQITGDQSYLQQVYKTWQFIQSHIRDAVQGEWFWGVTEQYAIMPGQDKAGFWKCPYHNARACMELVQRIDAARVV